MDSKPENDVRTYARAKALVERRFFFVVHLATYILIIAIVCLLDYGFGSEPHWSWIMAWAWGIGIASHGVSAFLLADNVSRTPLEATLRERRRGFYLHLFIYLNCVLLMLVVNGRHPLPDDFLADSSLPAAIQRQWWIWPTLFWGVAVLYHWFFRFVVRGWRVKKLKQLWTLKVMKEIDGVTRGDKE